MNEAEEANLTRVVEVMRKLGILEYVNSGRTIRLAPMQGASEAPPAHNRSGGGSTPSPATKGQR